MCQSYFLITFKDTSVLYTWRADVVTTLHKQKVPLPNIWFAYWNWWFHTHIKRLWKSLFLTWQSFLKRAVQLPSRFKTSWETGFKVYCSSRFIIVQCWGHTWDFCPTNTNGGRTQAFEQDFEQKGGDGEVRLKNVYSQMSKKLTQSLYYRRLSWKIASHWKMGRNSERLNFLV